MDTGRTFNWQDSRIFESAKSQRAHEAIEALHSGEHSVDQVMQLDPLQVKTFTALIGMPQPSSPPHSSPLFHLLYTPLIISIDP